MQERRMSGEANNKQLRENEKLCPQETGVSRKSGNIEAVLAGRTTGRFLFLVVLLGSYVCRQIGLAYLTLQLLDSILCEHGVT